MNSTSRSIQFRTVSLLIAISALLCLPFADLATTQLSPWTALERMATGAVTPDFGATEYLWQALLHTVAFALQGISLAAVTGFTCALFYQHRSVRMVAAVIRSVHELFWALIFLQLFGLSSLTAVLALWIPYSGIFTKVFGEILEEIDKAALAALPKSSNQRLSQRLYAELPIAWPHIVSYARYRFECGMRSSIVLGFVGLPTLGFHLESAFRQGDYSEAAALLYLFYLLIATMRWWFRGALIPLYLAVSLVTLTPTASVDWSLVWEFISYDIVPAPLRGEGFSWQSLGQLQSWLSLLWQQQILPGSIDTLLLSQLALLATAMLALLWFPLRNYLLFSAMSRVLGNLFLIITRSTPEFVLAFVALLLLGPSLLPAIIALALHNGAIIAHLCGGYSNNLLFRTDDKPTPFSRLSFYLYQLLPRIYPQFITWLLYRWEIIQRETAILGFLGITTLGFYVDSAFEELRFDRALVLIIACALLNLMIDTIARTLRRRLQAPVQLSCRDA
ncbi:PhnE/PtxC family ABC transporter permease [Ferrimonas lipolytica]|uniref:ABC transporter permease n=1 Tax=Ferrimonas lipolytica TaxID=2724191 RepID=A0A6H1UDV0_9GAMM|nr:ABC transporter permease [Ferrimonas lipolytica]QIZ75972.1 ABC transporter permease [Ferrimonas lipolytica]